MCSSTFRVSGPQAYRGEGAGVKPAPNLLQVGMCLQKFYGKSWRVGNTSRNETNEILTVYLVKGSDEARIKMIYNRIENKLEVKWQGY